MCFDKTGTLTEDGLNFYGVMPFKVGCDQILVPFVTRFHTNNAISGHKKCINLLFKAGGQFAGEVVRNVSEIDEADPLKICLASCHRWTTKLYEAYVKHA